MKDRVVYSSEKGRICPRCGWPASDCHCAEEIAKPQEPVPSRIVAKLRVENAGSGKKVTVIDGLPKNTEFLASLARELKKSCGTGGKPGDGSVELQGDQRERLYDFLSRKGWTVKGWNP
ncbi:MAG TPA: stress response translation initiation inhibitor YciH [Thermoanaerobaculia bacterium]|nr:stress response translation initiation inhibitor YciH [Thermoanaerobaculia bacterium]